MKGGIRVAILLLVSCCYVFAAAPCDTFDSSTLGWGTTFATISPTSGYITVTDLAGTTGSSINAPATWTGNYWSWFANGCGQFCFDIRMLDDSLAGSPALARHFSFYSASFTATFSTTTTLVEGQPWRRFCAPIAPLDANGQPPTTPDGFWTFGPAGSLNAANWNAHWSAINAARFGVDTSPTQMERFWLDNICLRSLANNPPPVPAIVGSISACVASSYCIRGNSAFQYTWSATSTNNQPLSWAFSSTAKYCIDVTFPPGQGGWINVTVDGSFPFCGRSVASLYVAPCDVLAEECCKDKKLTITKEIVKFSGNKLVFTPTLSYPGLTLKIKTTLVSGLYVANICRTGTTVFQHPVTVTAGYNANFVGSIHPTNAPYPQAVQWFTNTFGSTSGTFPITIGNLPPAPKWPCTQQIRFCVEYTFFFGCCESCTVVECYSYNRQPFIIIDWPIPATVKPGEILRDIPVKTFDEEGPVVANANVTLKIVSAPRGARLLGAGGANVDLASGAAVVSGLFVTRPGTYVLEAQAVFTDTFVSPEGDKFQAFTDAYEFSLNVAGEVFEPVIPPVINDVLQ